MAVRFDLARHQHVIEFQQGHQRVFERCPRGVTKAQAQARETLLRRGLYDRVSLGRQEELSLEEAIGRWLEDHHGRIASKRPAKPDNGRRSCKEGSFARRQRWPQMRCGSGGVRAEQEKGG